ncbi:MAG: IS4 family transposase [Beijerinckiaceae bacterium]
MRCTAVARRFTDNRADAVACTRFLRNPKVKVQEIVQTAAGRTNEAAAGRHVLLVEDTSEINYQAKRKRKRGLGQVGNGSDIGLFVHPALAVDAHDGSILGLAGATIWRRAKVKDEKYQSLPIEDKESYRWIETALKARAALPAPDRVTVVADREADIYEVFARLPDRRTDVLIRANHNRALADKQGHLFDEIAAQPEAGRLTFDLPARPGRPARHVTLAVRFGKISLRQPKVGVDPRDPPAIQLHMVEVKEVDPPSQDDAVVWRLLTTHEVASLEQAAQIVDLYRKRWSIEQMFRTVKSQGFDLEESLIADGDALECLAATTLIATTMVMQLVHGRGVAGWNLPATRLFNPSELAVLDGLIRKLEGRTEKQKNPHSRGSLAWAAWTIARLGGWKGYAKERPPGPITFIRGLERFHAITEGFALANEARRTAQLD